jgi:FkbM family methyltransferase
MIRKSAVMLAVLAGGMLCGVLLYAGLQLGSAVVGKVSGSAPDCPWGLVLTMDFTKARLDQTWPHVLKSLSVLRRDDALGIELISSPTRQYWIKHTGHSMGGKELLSYLLADHGLLAGAGPEHVVRKGDVVLDCGAHVGIFTLTALGLGAAKVVAVEPDPVNLECLRRNLAPEIAAGKVVVAGKGVWSSDGSMSMLVAEDNSGANSMLWARGHYREEVPVTTIDHLRANLGLPCISYIKMDIEGAEREALRGAMGTLKECRPRMMIDSYHRPDDMQVLPAIIREAHADYLLTCASCERFPETSNHIVPHVVFYR